jgi:MazG family protein
MARLVLVDTSDDLPGLLPLHGWSALMSSELVVIGGPEHPFAAHLANADLAYESLANLESADRSARSALLGQTPLVGQAGGGDQRRAELVVDRAQQLGEITYLHGPQDSDGLTRAMGLEAARREVELEAVYFGVAPKGVALLGAVETLAALRAPDGCPWDREQTHDSLGPHATEEVYELLDAIDSGEPEHIREELGDVLLQVVFHAQVAEDHGHFTIDDVASGLRDKLVRRHPHVFGAVDDDELMHTVGQGPDAQEVAARWEQLKAAEKPDGAADPRPFDGVPASQPALGYLAQLQRRAGAHGFVWSPDPAEAVRSRVAEVEQAPDETSRKRGVGDLLADVVAMARSLDIDPESALRGSAGRFRARFDAVAAAAEAPLDQLSDEQWRQLWRETAAAAEPSEHGR